MGQSKPTIQFSNPDGPQTGNGGNSSTTASSSSRSSPRPRPRQKAREFSVDDDADDAEPAEHDGAHVGDEHMQSGPGPAPAEVSSPSDSASVRSEESFTMRERQDAINTAHPFGIRIWKPALYKKRRSVEANAEEDIHWKPSRFVPASVRAGNLLWTLTFGLVLCVTCLVIWAPLFLLTPFFKHSVRYANLLRELALFFLVPFGKYVQLNYNENYREEDDGHGRPVADYVAWQNAVDSDASGAEPTSRLFFAPRRRRPSQHFDHNAERRFRLFGRGRWTAARVLYFIGFYVLLVPVALGVSALCWFSVFGVPMARVIVHMLQHLRIHPLALSVRPTSEFTDEEAQQPESFSIILCTYRAFGFKYYKYTVGGTNVILLNLMLVVFVTLFDFSVTHTLPKPAIFGMSLVSIIPLAHFIGQAVASISAQSSMSMGATINAFFSTIVEVYLYLVALRQGKGELVEGSITGSVMAGVLLLPGLSMCAGAFKRKTQRFNPKSAAATSTMLMYTLVGVLGPSIFYYLYGPSEVHCENMVDAQQRVCWSVVHELRAVDPVYFKIVKPFGALCAVCLFVAYAVGLWFTLRTHAAMIWTTGPSSEEIEQTDPEDGPNWDRTKSYVILISATLLYAMIAEVLVDSVDIVLEHVNVSQRVLGLTIFALVPNTTEFLNAISFAMYGNVALSLEIGGAYALQVCLLQVPALVLASQQYIGTHLYEPLRDYVFILLFPKWDTWVWMICMVLYGHMHSEGRSNYFKGSILLLAYFVLLAGFLFNDVIYELLPQDMLQRPGSWPPTMASPINAAKNGHAIMPGMNGHPIMPIQG